MQNDDYKIIILTVNALKRNARQLHVAEKLLTEYKQEKGSNFPFLYLDDREFYKTVEHILEEDDVNELFFIDSQIKSIIEQKKLLWESKKEIIKYSTTEDILEKKTQNYLLIEKAIIKTLITQIVALKILIKHTCLHISESLKKKFPDEDIPEIDFSFMENDKTQ